MKKVENDEHIGVLVKYISNAITNDINKELSKFDLTSVQEEVLIFLCMNEDEIIYQKDIEAHLKLKNPTVTGIVKRLEEKGMIKRFPGKNDGRCKCHVITEKGKEIVEHSINHGCNYIEKKLIANFTPEEHSMLTKLLKKVLKNMEE